MWNKRRERLERDLDRQFRILEVDAREWEFPRERCSGHPGQPRRVLRSQSAFTLERREHPRFEYARYGLRVARLHPDARERVAERVAFGGPVENLPVAQLPSATKADAAGSDSAEWEGDGRE